MGWCFGCPGLMSGHKAFGKNWHT